MIDLEYFNNVTTDLGFIGAAKTSYEYHKALVKRFYVSLPDRYKGPYLDTKIENHDEGKITSPAEIFSYAQYKRGESWSSDNQISPEIKRILGRASKEHYMVSTHHPEFWGDREMDRNAIIEMICDWASVSFEINGNLKNMKKWYLDTGKNKFNFNARIESLVYELISVLGG